jgi:diadenosine tetraphosphate (Ap4A) HIT family hydrolase
MELDPRLKSDCLELGNTGLCRLLLMNNRHLPWFILVPDTPCTEVCELDPDEQGRLWAEVNSIARFVRREFSPDKLNIAAIGNVVSQLHVHVVGRFTDDYCWPGVVWGAPGADSYPATEAHERVSYLREQLGELLL